MIFIFLYLLIYIFIPHLVQIIKVYFLFKAFFGMMENTNLEQGPIYFYFVSLVLSLRAKFISPVLLQSEISFAIQ